MTYLGKYKGLASLALLLVVLPLAAWKLAVADTVRMHRESRRMEKAIELAGDGEGQGGKSGSGVIATTDMIQSPLLMETMGLIAANNGAKVTGYTHYTNQNDNGLLWQTAEIELTGTYRAIVKAVYEIESDIAPSKLASLAIRMVRDPYNRKGKLVAILYIEQLRQI